LSAPFARRPRDRDQGPPRFDRRRARRLFASRLGVTAENTEGFDEKGFLGGRVLLRQLPLGHRSGTDAALVIAAARPDARGHIADLGAGSGAIGLSLAVLEPSLEVTLIELDPQIAALAAESAALNGCAGRVRSLTANVEEFARSPRSHRELGAHYDL